jgi:hypothetical protein
MQQVLLYYYQEVPMAKETQRFSITLPQGLYRRAKKYAHQDYGDNMSQLIRVAVSEFMERHYDEKAEPSVGWGGWRGRDEKEGQRAAVGAT